ncbi:17766_t:CDS:2 [Gigaspora margarita]|uniref:17766_t:CDS:1 n=1 Tax=Gigaspora margarita TaxID=4874 RepID=A0ABM8W1P3_GIGMA|nr:17766_t:CDS:2 [Gigaspora margarita]
MIPITVDPETTTKPELPPNLMQYFNVTQHTWARHNQSSQLDDFWTTPDIITNCPGINIFTSTGSTDSDLAILDIK